MKFIVTVIEEIKYSCVVEATDEDDAFNIINEGIINGKIDLTCGDITDREISVDEPSEQELKYDWWKDYPVYPNAENNNTSEN